MRALNKKIFSDLGTRYSLLFSLIFPSLIRVSKYSEELEKTIKCPGIDSPFSSYFIVKSEYFLFS